jgi:hypothetical protein
MARKQFEIWEVDGVEYKLKLKTSTICKLEEKLKTSLMDVLGMSRTMPPLSTMLIITHGAMKDWNSNLKLDDVRDLFDKYCDEGGSQLDFFSKIFMGIYQVSGFFTEAQGEQMEKQMEAAQEAMQ